MKRVRVSGLATTPKPGLLNSKKTCGLSFFGMVDVRSDGTEWVELPRVELRSGGE